MTDNKLDSLSLQLKHAVYQRINKHFASAVEKASFEAENVFEAGLLAELRHIRHALELAGGTSSKDGPSSNDLPENSMHLHNQSKHFVATLVRILGDAGEAEAASSDGKSLDVFRRIGHLTTESTARSRLDALRDPLHDRIRQCQQITNYLSLYKSLHDLLDRFHELRTGQSTPSASDSVIQDFLPTLARVCLPLAAHSLQNTTECRHLRLFAAQTWQYCIKTILQDVYNDAQPTFRQLGYPSWQTAWQKPVDLSLSPTVISKFTIFVRRLCAVEACCRKHDMRKRSSQTSFDWPNALRLLFIPFERCFCYHFYAGDIVVATGENAKEQEAYDAAREFSRHMTADAERPEFFLHVTRQWIEHHMHFFRSFIQPIYDQYSQQHDDTTKTALRLNCAEEFAFFIVRMVNDKLMREWHREGSVYKRNKFLFAHVVEEVFLFARKLQDMGFSSATMNINSVIFLIEPEVFSSWSRIVHEQCKFNVERVCSSLLLLDTPSASTVVVGIEGSLNEQVELNELHPLAMASIELGRKLALIFQSVTQDRLTVLPSVEARCRVYKDLLDSLLSMHAELRNCAIAFDTVKGHQNVDVLTSTTLPSNFVKYMMLFKITSIALTKFRSLLESEPVLVKLLMDESDMTPAMVLAMSQMPAQLKQDRAVLRRRTESCLQKCTELQSGIIDAAVDATHEAIVILMQMFLLGNLKVVDGAQKPVVQALNAFGRAKLSANTAKTANADTNNELLPALRLIASTITNAAHAFILFVPAHVLVPLCRDFILSIDKKLVGTIIEDEELNEKSVDLLWLSNQLRQLVETVDAGIGFQWLQQSNSTTTALSRLHECSLLLRLKQAEAVLLVETLEAEKSPSSMQKASKQNAASLHSGQKILVDGKSVTLHALTSYEIVQMLRKRHDLQY